MSAPRGLSRTRATSRVWIGLEVHGSLDEAPTSAMRTHGLAIAEESQADELLPGFRLDVARSTRVVDGPLAMRMQRLAAEREEASDVKSLPFRLSLPVLLAGL